MIDLKEFKAKAEKYYHRIMIEVMPQDVVEICERAIAAESKLAEIEAQEPIARGYKNSKTGTCSDLYWLGDIPEGETNLYALPVQPSPAVAVPDDWQRLPTKDVLTIAPMAGNFTEWEQECFAGGFRRCASMLSTPTPPSAEQTVMSGDWTPSGREYDRNIHHNPDAKAWADLFVATFPRLADKHEIMLGWFSNAMMAMHDHIKSAGEQLDSAALNEEQLYNNWTWSLEDSSNVFSDPSLAAKTAWMARAKLSPTKPQRITEQDVREIIQCFEDFADEGESAYGDQHWIDFLCWSGNKLLAKLNEHREPDYKAHNVSYPSGTWTLIVPEPDVNGVVIVRDESGEYRRVHQEAIAKANASTDSGVE